MSKTTDDFLCACEQCDVKKFKRLLPVVLNLRWPKGMWQDALYGAAAGGHLDIIKLLEGHTRLAHDHCQAFRVALEENHVDVIDFFLKKLKKEEIENVAHAYLFQPKKAKALALLMPVSELSKDDIASALYSAAHHGDNHLVEVLLPWPDSTINQSEALEAAATQGHLDIVKKLAPLSDPLANQSSALRGASRQNRVAVVDFLWDVSDPEAACRWMIENREPEKNYRLIKNRLTIQENRRDLLQKTLEVSKKADKKTFKM